MSISKSIVLIVVIIFLSCNSQKASSTQSSDSDITTNADDDNNDLSSQESDDVQQDEDSQSSDSKNDTGIIDADITIQDSDAAPVGTYAKSVTQFGITWTFDKEYLVGQFVNGDWWVVGPVKIIKIDPESKEVSGTTTIEGFTVGSGDDIQVRTMNGSMINPSPKSGLNQGFDNETYQWHPVSGRLYDGHYDKSLNVALGVSGTSALTVSSSSSIVSTISKENGARSQVKAAAILTVLDSAAAQGSFRPPYSGSDKTIYFNKSQLKWNLLKKLAKVDETPNIEDVANYFEKPWIDHVPDWSARYIHPSENMPDYGREISTQIGEAALMLHLDFSDSEKETLLIRFVQLGIDLYGIVKDGGKDNWKPAGGHTNGRKWPIMFAGFLLDDKEMKNIGQISGDYLYSDGHGIGNPPDDYVNFNEDGQTFYVSQDEVDKTHDDKWNPDKRNADKGETEMYEISDIGLPEWGIDHTDNQYADNKHWNAVYRTCCTANSYGGFILAAHIMSLKKEWNHDALFDYLDRYVEIESAKEPKPSSVLSSKFADDMWLKYRDNYPPVWISSETSTKGPEAIAVWAFPDSAVIEKETTIGVSAYHSSGIDNVSFYVDVETTPRAIKKYEQINNSTGEYEYLFEIDPSDFTSADTTIKAKVTPVHGKTAEHSIKLYINSAIVKKDVYMSTTGNDSTGDGTKAKPFKSIGKALDELKTLKDSEVGYVRLLNGTYQFSDEETQSGRGFSKYITITPESGKKDDVIFTKLPGNMRDSFLKFEKITFDMTKGEYDSRGTMFNTYSAHHHWFDDCTFISLGANRFDNYQRALVTYGDSQFVTVENSKFIGTSKAIVVGGKGNFLLRNNDVTSIQDTINIGGSNFLGTGNILTVTPPPRAFIESPENGSLDLSGGKTLEIHHNWQAGSDIYKISNWKSYAANESAATLQEVADTLNADPVLSVEMVAEIFAGHLRLYGKRTNYTQKIWVSGSANSIFNFAENSEETQASGSGHHADFFQNWGDRESDEDFFENFIIRNNYCSGKAQGVYLGEYTGLKNIAVINNVIDSGTAWVINIGATKELTDGEGKKYFPKSWVENLLLEYNTLWSTRLTSVYLSTNEHLSRKDYIMRNNIFGSYASANEIDDANYTMDYNCYYLAHSSNTISSNSISKNPEFNSSADIGDGVLKVDDFHLKSISPCIDNAFGESGVFYDQEWKLRDSNPDRGGLEYR